MGSILVILGRIQWTLRGMGMPRSLQMARAVPGAISLCRGTDVAAPSGKPQTAWRLPSRSFAAPCAFEVALEVAALHAMLTSSDSLASPRLSAPTSTPRR
jgi:hypothetical protein